MNIRKVVIAGSLLGFLWVAVTHGKEAVQAKCPDPEASDVSYVSQDPALCAVVFFVCDEEQTPFSNACGCGCVGAGNPCPDPAAPEVSYVSQDPAVCARVLFTCGEGETLFSGACGCGCVKEDPRAPCVIAPTGACTRDINQCGNPSICQCPDGYTYDEVVGKCLRDLAQEATEYQRPVDRKAATAVPEERIASNECVLAPQGMCTRDINPCGNPSICHCPIGYAYNPVVGRCVKTFEQCGGIQGIACPKGQLCDLPAGECTAADLMGTCVARPEACTEEFRPVCGCDGKTYPNECHRLLAGVQKARDGACEQAAACGGIQGIACPAGQICDLPAGQCQAADLTGSCVAQPQICTQDFTPVCGCDGRTYSNDCQRLIKGVQKAHDGACPQSARQGKNNRSTY